jgi:hypothetical protein
MVWKLSVIACLTIYSGMRDEKVVTAYWRSSHEGCIYISRAYKCSGTVRAGATHGKSSFIGRFGWSTNVLHDQSDCQSTHSPNGTTEAYGNSVSQQYIG